MTICGAFLGNGRTQLENQYEAGIKVDIAPYIRDADTPLSPNPIKAKL
jgi:hypothetical protein